MPAAARPAATAARGRAGGAGGASGGWGARGAAVAEGSGRGRGRRGGAPGRAVPLLGAYEAALEVAPLATQCATSCVVFGASDAMAQRCGVRDLDLARCGRFALFGAAVQAPLFSAYFASQDAAVEGLGIDGVQATLLKLGFDQLVWTPFGWLPLFFGGMALLEGRGASDALVEAQSKGWGFTDTCVKNWALWVPANLLTYSVVPPQMRILWVNSVSLLWTAYLSRVQRGPRPGD